MKFTKMHGLGNDFIILDAIENDLSAINFTELALTACNRKFGIGADGLIVVQPSEVADARMQIFNADGSEPEMCGNGIRCFAKYVYEKGEITKDVISVETRAGIMIPALILEGNLVKLVEVDMGEPRLLRKEIPMTGGDPDERVINHKSQITNHKLQMTCVSMGNPHCVIFVEDVHRTDVSGIGSQVETADLFPEKTNVEFIQVVDSGQLMMRVWERGVGETLACGTGACAAVVASVLTEKTDREVVVRLAGGDLKIEWQKEDNHVTMTGPAETVFSGELEL